MGVCVTTLMAYLDGHDQNPKGYDDSDIINARVFAEFALENGVKTSIEGVDWHGFIKWADEKLPPSQTEGERE